MTVDGLVLCDGHVLLIRRGKAPGRGLYAIPGGFLDQRETLYQAIVRELAEETNLKLLSGSMRDCLKAVVVFDHPDRSLRGRSITHTHFFDLGKRRRPEVQAGDDAEAVEWVPVEKLIEMEELFHDDHFSQLDHLLGLTKAAAPR